LVSVSAIGNAGTSDVAAEGTRFAWAIVFFD